MSSLQCYYCGAPLQGDGKCSCALTKIESLEDDRDLLTAELKQLLERGDRLADAVEKSREWLEFSIGADARCSEALAEWRKP